MCANLVQNTHLQVLDCAEFPLGERRLEGHVTSLEDTEGQRHDHAASRKGHTARRLYVHPQIGVLHFCHLQTAEGHR